MKYSILEFGAAAVEQLSQDGCYGDSKITVAVPGFDAEALIKFFKMR